jgi:hypothetical protein
LARLWGREWTRDELEQRVGDMLQVAGVRKVTLADGREQGVEAYQVRTGTGFEFLVLASRGMDIAHAEHSGRALAWRSMTEDAHPAYHERQGLGWLRTFYGGLVVTCGLSQAGAPNEDQGTPLGLHGRISHAPARNVWADAGWDGDEYVISLGGKCHEGVVFGENLVLRREITTRLGADSFTMTDTVENLGYTTVPFMLLYHINIGWPVVDDGSELLLAASETTPRDAEAEQGKEHALTFEGPTREYKEKVYFHDLIADAQGWATTAIVNRAHGIGAYCRFRPEELPHFSEWKQMGQRNYVVGLEPGNCKVLGRAKEREAGRLQFLGPRESRTVTVEVGALPDAAAISRVEEELRAVRR